ncbi:hypothetical protein ACH4E7_40325 [Kitasatospora sp. NPDC018058]|uniref:hypothetical protein n=1 Tax=Kitasatospora sp. NPDC018058 TaxID=3364025 RepID=UPI0037C01A93
MREHLLDVGRIHAAFVTDAQACGPLDLVPAPEPPAGDAGVYRAAAHLAYTAGHDAERHRLRAFIERPRPGAGDEQTAARLAACARVWEQAGEDGSGRAWERRWRSYLRLLVVLVGTAASGVRSAVADLRLAAEENPAVPFPSLFCLPGRPIGRPRQGHDQPVAVPYRSVRRRARTGDLPSGPA